MTQVFLSHSSVDAAFALKVADDLRSAGIPVWKAPESIRPGESWVQAITRGVTTSSHMLILMSDAAAKSKWVNFEFEMVLPRSIAEDKVKIIPLEYQDCNPPASWTVFQYFSGLDQDYTNAILRLIRRINEEQPVNPPQPTTLSTTINVTIHGDIQGSINVAGGSITYIGQPQEPTEEIETIDDGTEQSRRDPQLNARNLFQIASTQGGFFTSSQARQAGYAYSQMDYHVKRGTWEKIDRGIYLLHNYPLAERPDLIRLTLWSHNREGDAQAVASHETALAIHGLSDLMPAMIHLTVPPEFRKEPPPHTVLHKARLGPKEIELREGYYVTRPLRTLLDAANSALSPEHINQAVRDALDKGMIRWSVLKSVECSPEARKKLDRALEAIQRDKID